MGVPRNWIPTTHISLSFSLTHSLSPSLNRSLSVNLSVSDCSFIFRTKLRSREKRSTDVKNQNQTVAVLHTPAIKGTLESYAAYFQNETGFVS